MSPRSSVEIKEPAVEQLGKDRSCLKRSCFSSCLFLILIVASFWVFIKLAAAPKELTLSQLKNNIPRGIPIYDEDNIRSVSSIEAQDPDSLLEYAAMIPKAVIVPLYLAAEDAFPKEIQDAFAGDSNAQGFERYIELVKQPIFEHEHRLVIEWYELTAQPDFILNYYEKELEKEGFAVKRERTTTRSQELSFEKRGVRGFLEIKDRSDNRGTDETIMTIIFSDFSS